MLRSLFLALAACLFLPSPATAGNARTLAVQRRERQAEDGQRLLDYRRERRIPTPAAATSAVAAAQAAAGQLRQAEPAALERLLDETDERLAAARALLDRHWPGDLVLRVGVGPRSFGRYAWRDRFGGLVWDVADWNRLASPAETSPIRLAPPGATLLERHPPVTSWTSARHASTLQVAGGTVSWQLTESILAPGVLLETGAAAVEFARGEAAPRGPDRILVPVRDSALSRRRADAPDLPLPEDNWLLLCWERQTGEPPALLVFETLPARLEWHAAGLTVHFAGAAGKIAVGSYAGIGEWSPETSRAWQAVPRQVVLRCRQQAALHSHFPVGIVELFGVDETNGEVEIVQLLESVPFTFSGRISKQPATPLPPALATAKEEGLPLDLPPLLQDWELATRAGPYQASAGTSARIRLPLLRYDHPIEPAATTAPAQPLVLPDPLLAETLCQLLPAWTGLAPADRERLAQAARKHLAQTLQAIAAGQHHTFIPELGGYVELDRQASLATLRQSALLLDATYRYAKYSGDWDFVRAHATALDELLEVQIAMTDWALLGPAPRDALPADALPEALRGALAMSQMAEAVGAVESLRRARYLTARLLIPHTAGFRAQSTRPANRWSETRLAATWDGLPFPAAFARVAGHPPLPEILDAGLAACRLEVLDWLRRDLPRRYPDWTGEGPAAAELRLLDRLLDLRTEDAEPPRLATGHPLRRRLAHAPPEVPIRLAEWQPAALGAFLYDPSTRTARLELAGATGLRCTVRQAPAEIRRNGHPLRTEDWAYSREHDRLFLRLEEGEHTLDFLFPPRP